MAEFTFSETIERIYFNGSVLEVRCRPEDNTIYIKHCLGLRTLHVLRDSFLDKNEEEWREGTFRMNTLKELRSSVRSRLIYLSAQAALTVHTR